MTKIGKLVKDIQYATDLSVDQIARRIKFSRPHLQRLLKNGESQKVLDALNEKFGNALSKKPVPATTDIRVDDISLQSILNLTESNRMLAEAIAELSKKLKK